MTISAMQVSFTGGEWSPSLHARVDLAKYASAVRTCKNFVVHPHGGVSNRAGTQFIAEVKDSSKTVRLIPFQFSVTQGYVLEFGDTYMRVYKDGGQVLLDSPPAAYNAGTTYDQGDHVSYGGANYYSLAGSNTGNTPSSSPSWWYTLTDDIVEVKTPYAEADLATLKFTQSYDVLFLTHPSYPPYELSRTDHDEWTLTQISFGSSIAAPTGLSRTGSSTPTTNFKVTAVTEEGEESAPSSAKAIGPTDTLTWSAVTGADHYNVYKIQNGIYGWVGEAGSTSFTDSNYVPDMDFTAPKVKTPFGSSSNYPGVCEFFEQRLLFGRTNSKPQTIWGSQTGNFRNFNISSPLQDDDSFNFTLSALQVNEVRALVSLDDLIVLTSGGEWKMTAGSNSDAVTPTSVDLKPQSRWGSSHVRPLVIGNTVLFVDGSGAVVRDLLYSLEEDGYKGNDLTLLARHLLRDKTITDWCFQQFPDSIVWAVRSDGKLLGLTYAREHEVWGWHQHETEGYFEAISSITTTAGDVEVYTVVRRTIDGSTKRYVELFADRLPEEDVTQAWFVDSGLQYDGWNTTTDDTLELSGGSDWLIGETLTLTAAGHTPFSGGDVGKYYTLRSGDDSVQVIITAYTSSTVVSVQAVNRTVPDSLQDTATYDWALMVSSLSGLDHLEGEEVAVLADGAVVDGKTVSSGAISLTNPVSRVTIGLGYTSDLETLEMEVGGEGNTLQDRARNIPEATIRLENTQALWVGPDADNLDEIPFRETELLGTPVDLFTGDKDVFLESSDEPRQGRVFMRNLDPVPVTILSVIPRIEYGEL